MKVLTDEEQGKENVANLEADAKAMLALAEGLKGLPAESQQRIIRALAVFFDVRVPR